MNTALLHQIALTLIPHIGCVQARVLLEHFEAEEVFKAPRRLLEKIEGLGEVRIKSIKSFANFADAENELAFIEKYKIQPVFIRDEAYPKRLLNCYDAPVMLYYKGSANLNQSKIIAIVGSRTHTEYGKALTEQLVKELSGEQIMIVSGLAYGIDSVAHKACLKNEIPTVGVLAHGLDKIYPNSHKELAREMARQGGLLTEFRHTAMPDRHNFPSRNRIVAGMSDATIVIETDMKGGSMITAELANGYNKDVFAVPGKITDKKSSGSNHLIKNNKAILLTDAAQLLETMGWTTGKKQAKPVNRELFLHFTPEEQVIIDVIKKTGAAGIDEIYLESMLSSSAVAATLLGLEMRNVIQGMPGKRYQLSL